MSALPSKGDLRKAALDARDAMEAHARVAASEKLGQRALPFEVAAGTVVSGYSPIRSELDPVPLMRKLAAQGARLALPAILGRGKSLVFRAWTSGDRLTMGPLGILEPSPAMAELVPDIMLVPLAAFDRLGHRIGYGRTTGPAHHVAHKQDSQISDSENRTLSFRLAHNRAPRRAPARGQP